MKKEIGKEKVLEGEVKRKMSCTFLVGRVLVGNNKEDKTQDSRIMQNRMVSLCLCKSCKSTTRKEKMVLP